MSNNLDLICAQKAQEIAEAKIDEDLIRETLGVLQEDGVYACFLYLLAKDERKRLKDFLGAFLQNRGLISNATIDKSNVHTVIGPLTNSLEKLLFAKSLLERVLTYARYHAKAYAEKKK